MNTTTNKKYKEAIIIINLSTIKILFANATI